MKRFLVGIGGGSGSGKTYLAERLAEALGDRTVRVAQDWYYLENTALLPPNARAACNFDVPDAIEWPLLLAHLKALASGQTIDAPIYDFACHNRIRETQRIMPRPIILVEGIHCATHAPLREVLDCTIYVETPADIRFIRRLERDIAERGRSVESVVRQYLKQVRPMHEKYVEPYKDRADLVVSGEKSRSVKELKRIICLLEDRGALPGG